MNAKWKNDRKDVTDVINAIYLKCIDCSCWAVKPVEECFDDLCPLYPYRLDGDISRTKTAILIEARGNKVKKCQQNRG